MEQSAAQESKNLNDSSSNFENELDDRNYVQISVKEVFPGQNQTEQQEKLPREDESPCVPRSDEFSKASDSPPAAQHEECKTPRPRHKRTLEWDNDMVLEIIRNNTKLKNKLAQTEEENLILKEKVETLEENLKITTAHCQVLKEQSAFQLSNQHKKTFEICQSLETSTIASKLFQSQQEVQKLILDREHIQEKLNNLQEDRWQDRATLQKELWNSQEYISQLEMLLAPEDCQNFIPVQKEKELKKRLNLAESLISQLVLQVENTEIENFLNSRKHDGFLASHVVTNTLAKHNRRLIFNNQKLAQENQHLRSENGRLKFSLMGAQVARDYFKNNAIELGLKMKHTFVSQAVVPLDTPMLGRLTRQTSFTALDSGRMALELTPQVAQIFRAAKEEWLKDLNSQTSNSCFELPFQHMEETSHETNSLALPQLLFLDCKLFERGTLLEEEQTATESICMPSISTSHVSCNFITDHVLGECADLQLEYENNEENMNNNSFSDDEEDGFSVRMDYECPFQTNPPLEKLSSLYEKYRDIVGYPPSLMQSDMINMISDDTCERDDISEQENSQQLPSDNDLCSGNQGVELESSRQENHINDAVDSFLKRAAAVNGICQQSENKVTLPNRKKAKVLQNCPAKWQRAASIPEFVPKQTLFCGDSHEGLTSGTLEPLLPNSETSSVVSAPGGGRIFTHHRTNSNVSTVSTRSFDSTQSGGLDGSNFRLLAGFESFPDPDTPELPRYAQNNWDDYCLPLTQPADHYSLSAILSSQPGHDDTWNGDSSDFHVVINQTLPPPGSSENSELSSSIIRPQQPSLYENSLLTQQSNQVTNSDMASTVAGLQDLSMQHEFEPGLQGMEVEASDEQSYMRQCSLVQDTPEHYIVNHEQLATQAPTEQSNFLQTLPLHLANSFSQGCYLPSGTETNGMFNPQFHCQLPQSDCSPSSQTNGQLQQVSSYHCFQSADEEMSSYSSEVPLFPPPQAQQWTRNSNDGNISGSTLPGVFSNNSVQVTFNNGNPSASPGVQINDGTVGQGRHISSDQMWQVLSQPYSTPNGCQSVLHDSNQGNPSKMSTPSDQYLSGNMQNSTAVHKMPSDTKLNAAQAIVQRQPNRLFCMGAPPQTMVLSTPQTTTPAISTEHISGFPFNTPPPIGFPVSLVVPAPLPSQQHCWSN